MAERLRLLFAWPFLVIGGAFFMAGTKIGGAGARFALSDTFERLIEGYKNEKGRVEFVKQQRPYRSVPETERDGCASSTENLEAEFATILAATEEAEYSQITAF